jgi:DnaJ like chaperone protein
MKYAKWIGGGLGWALGGPIGGILGFAFGAMVEDKSLSAQEQTNQRRGSYNPRNDYQGYQSQRHRTRPGDFSSALLVLSAAVMKADGKHMKSELDYIRESFRRQFGEAVAAEQIGILKELLKKDIPVRDVCEQIKYYMEHAMRLQLIHYLYGIAKADGNVDASEAELVDRIAYYIGVSESDRSSIKAMFYESTDRSYTILEITKSATDDEVKKAFRKMAMKYHPDKVRDLGESHQKAAQDKFIEVQKAYEKICKERGIK